MAITPIDAGVASQIGHYADAVIVPAGYEQIIVSGTPGLGPEGDLPDTIVGQSQQAWENIARILREAQAEVTDIVSVRQWLVDESDISAYVEVRSRYLHHLPASMLAVIPALVRPGFLVEVEVIAARLPR
ncbi:MAG: Endoribonuclease [Microbacteriaceae bacterium]|nr:Endoribonuclease [Microbacteriaceae bacterium]